MRNQKNEMKQERKTSGVKDGTTDEIFEYVNKNLGLWDAKVNSVFYGEKGLRTYVRVEADYFLPSDLKNMEEAGLKWMFAAGGIQKQMTIAFEVL